METVKGSRLLIITTIIGILALAAASPACVGILTPVTVTYNVVGDGKPYQFASVTYANEGGGTEQQLILLPWSKSFSASAGAFLYVSAQARHEGSITASISINGKTSKSSTSAGEYVIATSSSRCCE